MRRGLRFGIIILLLSLISFIVYRMMAEKKPLNVLIITIDTLRADHLGAYGYSRKTSPALDQFAAGATLFDNAYCVMPTTVPSHASLFFGTWPRIHGSASNFMKISNTALQFLPASFRTAGYRTAAVLSVLHLGARFRSFAGFELIDFPDSHRESDVTLKIAQSLLRRHQNEKYFFWIHLWDPHSPYKLHPEFMKRINPDFQDNFVRKHAFHEPGFYDQATIQKMIDLYDNEIAYVDYHLGRFLKEMQVSGILDNTMIVVAADHGESLGELAGSYSYAFDHGEFLFDHQIRIPLMIRIPKGSARRVSNTVSMIDIMPTVLRAAGLPVPATVSGNSFLPLLYSQPLGHPTPLVFLQRRYFKTAPRPFLAGSQFAVRERTYKLIYNNKTGKTVLHRNDDEDRVASDPRASEQLEKHLKHWLQRTEKFAGLKAETVTEQEAEMLRSLGYIQ